LICNLRGIAYMPVNPPILHNLYHIPNLPRVQIVCHMMPDLPNVGWERDIEAFREFFESPAFRADGLKLYPTLVIRGQCHTHL